MHGRLKVKSTAQQQAEKDRERAQKLVHYNAAMQRASQKRHSQVYDDEALEITGQLLLANPDLYTMWNFRKEMLSSMKNSRASDDFEALVSRELEFTENCLRINAKSYGSWHHRIWTLEESPNPDWNNELLLCNKYLEIDERNFHCWNYRYYVRCRAGVSAKKELEFVDSKIGSNFSNYSSWHYRSKLLPLLYPDPEKLRPIQEERLLQEFDLVQNAMFTDPNDQSAWFYHRWLLGRGEMPLELHYLYVNRKNVIITFSKAVKVGALSSSIVVALNDHVQACDWHSDANFDEASIVWFAELSNTGLPCNADVVVASILKCDGVTSELSCHLLADKNESWVLKPSLWKEFSMALSTATSSVLQQELDSCLQLQELEPTCKWPLLTAALLLRSIHFQEQKERVLRILNDLSALDPLRSGFYKDLRSKFTMEYAVEVLDNDERELDLSALYLSSLYCLEYLIHLTKLNLSRNCLSTLNGISCLKCLEVLILDDNCIGNCDDVIDLCKLERVSLQNNSISSFDVLQPFSRCMALVEFDLRRNPVLNLTCYPAEVCKIMPSLKVLNGTAVQCSAE